jgi:Delta6-protoilludene synthase
VRQNGDIRAVKLTPELIRFWELAIETASLPAQERFVKTFGDYLQAVVQQAADRTQKHIRSIPEYLEVRRGTIGAEPTFAFLELAMNLPDEAVHHPVIEEMSILSTSMILLGNVGLHKSADV